MGRAEARRRARRRLAVSALVVVAVLGGLGIRLVQLQVLDRGRYEDMALAQRLQTVPVDAPRGSIFDRNGRDLAVSVGSETIWANPRVVTDPTTSAQRLAPLVGTEVDVLATRLADRSRAFVYVARRVDDEVAAAVRALGIPGIGFLTEPRRAYPAEALAAPVIGLVGVEGEGREGLEWFYDDVLAGQPGERVLEQDVQGRAIPRTERSGRPARAGTDLVLTIDQVVQYRAEQALVDQVAATGARGGMAVVVDVRTGDVVAMASVVGEDDEGPARPAGPLDRNRPLTDVFEPGSTSKLVTFATAIEEGTVGEHTPFEVPDWIRVADFDITDSEPHPTERWSTADCLRESSNVCTIMIARDLAARHGRERLDRSMRAFGLGEPTTIQFPGQSSGIVLSPDEYYGSGLESVAIGYSVGVTATQMLGAFVTIANAGESRPPRLVAARIEHDGERRTMPREPGQRVVSAATARVVTGMLTDVVSAGTGSCAAVPGYTVAGKTGTSRLLEDSGEYSSSRTMASFIGFAPAEDPRFAAIVVVDEPAAEEYQYGGRAAAPVFAEVMTTTLRTMRVSPPPGADSTQWERAAARAAELGVDCSVGSASSAGNVDSLPSQSP